MAGIAVTGSRKRYTAGGNVIDGVRTGVGMTGLTISIAADTAGSCGNERQILITGMTGGTGVMLQVVSRIGEYRIGYRGVMTAGAVNVQFHQVACIMINVMGKQVQGRTVINGAVALRTVAGGPAVLQGTVSVMTDGTGVMLDVIASIHKGLTRGYCCVMAGIAVAGSRQGHVSGCSMIDGMIIPGPAGMTGRTDRTAAGACRSVGNQGKIRGAGMTG